MKKRYGLPWRLYPHFVDCRTYPRTNRSNLPLVGAIVATPSTFNRHLCYSSEVSRLLYSFCFFIISTSACSAYVTDFDVKFLNSLALIELQITNNGLVWWNQDSSPEARAIVCIDPLTIVPLTDHNVEEEMALAVRHHY